MSLRKFYSLFLTAAVLLAVLSCKKDGEDASVPTLNGLTFECPTFVVPGQHVKLTPRGVKHPEGEGVGYYWKVTPTMAKIDTTRYENGLDKNGKETDGSFEFSFSDTLKTYTVVCYAFAHGYTGDSHIVEVQVVEGGLDRSITGTAILPADKKISHKGIDYYYMTAGGLDWFMNNLADDAAGAAYENQPATSTVFGRYYSYEEAMTACPEGWRLPTDAEWTSLGTEASELFADASFNGEPMLEYWPQVGEITNSSRISLIPAGFANLGEGSDGGYPQADFQGLYEYAAVWTSDLVADEEGMAYYRYLVEGKPEFFLGKGDVKSFGASVRCVRDVI